MIFPFPGIRFLFLIWLIYLLIKRMSSCFILLSLKLTCLAIRSQVSKISMHYARPSSCMSNSGLLYANSNSYSRHQSKTFDQPACFDRISPSQNGIKHILKSHFIFLRIIFSNISVLIDGSLRKKYLVKSRWAKNFGDLIKVMAFLSTI